MERSGAGTDSGASFRTGRWWPSVTRARATAFRPVFFPVFSIILLLKTTTSSIEFDASRLAPCTPVQAVSPAANSPAILVSPQLLVLMPPII